jgi:hypothetical protein
MDFAGIFVPGLNRHAWSAGPISRVTTFFQSPELSARGAATRFLPLCYQDILALIRRERPQAALFMCSPPDDRGNCSFGSEVAFIAALWREIPVRIAHINPVMPATPGDQGIPFTELAGYFEGEQALRSMSASRADLVSTAIAARVAALVADGATLQTGLGKVPDAVLRALSGHRGLRLHTGLAGDGALALARSGAMASGQSAIIGTAIGSTDLYAGLADPHFQFRPVTVTHDPAILSAIERLVTINSAMEVDLFGQVYAGWPANHRIAGQSRVRQPNRRAGFRPRADIAFALRRRCGGHRAWHSRSARTDLPSARCCADCHCGARAPRSTGPRLARGGCAHLTGDILWLPTRSS